MNAQAAALAVLFVAAGAHAQTWEFQVSLDGKPVGTHRFVVQGDERARRVESDADFDVRFLGFHVYRYRHHASETWQGDCLESLEARTDDDGKRTRVRAERASGATTVAVGGQTRADPACIMTFAYWNPAMRAQSRLLNPQTGELEDVRIGKAGEGELAVRGRPTAATRYRIAGAGSPIDVWYSAQGEWIGLDAVVGGRHALSYRLR